METGPQLALGGVGCPVCLNKLTVVFGRKTADANSRPAKKAKSEEPSPLEFKTSTKLEMMAEECIGFLERDETSKILVFSQFTRMLAMGEERLRRDHIQSARLAGDMTLEQRNNVILAFNRDPALKVLFISLKAGAEGLNLQCANRVLLLDPWWSPALEMQACQRAHRIGQTRPVECVRLICQNSIEEKILQLQEKKLLVFEGTVGQSTQALERLTPEDLAFLFQQ